MKSLNLDISYFSIFSVPLDSLWHMEKYMCYAMAKLNGKKT